MTDVKWKENALTALGCHISDRNSNGKWYPGSRFNNQKTSFNEIFQIFEAVRSDIKLFDIA